MEKNRCITNLLKFICLLQKNSTHDDCCDFGCDKPFLGPDCVSICFNTRPISIYTKCGDLFTIVKDDVTYSRFRIESVNKDCVTLRALNFTNGNYISTKNFVTVNTECICVVRCFSDTMVDNL